MRQPFRRLPVVFAVTALAAVVDASAATIAHEDIARPEGSRHYIVVRPDGAGAGKLPAIVLLHGHGASAAWLAGQADFAGYRTDQFVRFADRAHVLLLIPDGVPASDGKRAWNDCRADAGTNSTADDVGFIGALIDEAARRHGADADRVYAYGQSNGGAMVYRLGIEIAPRLAAIGVQSALMPAQSRCAQPTHPLPVFITHGTADQIAPYAGGKVSHWALRDRGSGVSVDQSVAIWRNLAGLPAQASAVYRFPHLHADDATSATRYVWGTAADGLQVELLRIDGGGHTGPTTSGPMPWLLRKLVGEMNHDVELTDELWAFFRTKRRNDKP